MSTTMMLVSRGRAFVATGSRRLGRFKRPNSNISQGELYPGQNLSFLSHQSQISRTLPGSSLSLSSTADNSAMSQSRPPFRMPKNSPDDSKASSKNDNNQDLTWNPLGLYSEVVDGLQNDLSLRAPTPIQSLVIPQMLKNPTESLAFLAATGSGKTLAYLLPVMQHLKHQEDFENYERRPRRPRVLVLAPTRELVSQITSVLKSVSHSLKVSSQALVGGQEKGKQRKFLQREVDIIVATPGRLLQHWKDENVFLGSVETVILDEMDTMLEQGFQRELRTILYPLLYPEGKAPASTSSSSKEVHLKEKAPRIILTSATMTQAVQKALGDNPKTSSIAVSAKKNYVKRGDGSDQAGNSPQLEQLQLPKMRIISAAGLHKAVPRLEQIFVDVGQTDKISLLLDVVSNRSSKENGATIIFCNTAASVRAVQFALGEARIESLSYHGDLNSAMRSENLKRFRDGASGKTDDPNILVCTDLAARGLDIPQVDHVVMFDFPLNALDYLHRSGRTARGDGQGKLTALVSKRDKVLATAIEQAVMKGEPLDGLSSRKSDYLPGAKFGVKPKRVLKNGKSARNRTDSSSRDVRPKKQKPKDTTMKKRRR